MESKSREEKDEFRRKLKGEWGLMWRERLDDKMRAEGIVVRDYPLLFMDRGFIVFATRSAKMPSFPEIVEYWSSQGMVYSPDPMAGGWGKFMKTEMKVGAHSRARAYEREHLVSNEHRQQLRKGGRGWLHK